MKEESFVKIPRSLFRSEGWKKATKEQRLAIVDLYYRVAYSDFEYTTEKGDMIPLKKGQLAVSLRKLASMLDMDKGKAERITKYWEECRVIVRQQMRQQMRQYTVLTIKALYDTCDHMDETANETHKEENINKKNINNPLKKSPLGDFSHALKKTITQEILCCAEELRERWNGYLNDDEKVEARRFNNYLPQFRLVLFSKDENIAIINRSDGIVKVGDGRYASWMAEFFELHLFVFVSESGLHNRLRSKALKEIAMNLLVCSQSLNIGQVALFFHLLRLSDARVGQPKWRNGFNGSEFMIAFGKFRDWVRGYN